MAYRTLDDVEVRGKRVLLRADLNVPVHNGAITDTTRIERVVPTIRELSDKGAKVILLSHFARPKGKVVPEMSLAPVGEAVSKILGRPVGFVHDCIGPQVKQAVDQMKDGDVLLLENTRFHAGEEANDPAFSKSLAENGDLYVDDAFSAAHRAHASTDGVAKLLPAFAGRLMQAELGALTAALECPERPVGAIIGGSKISTKLDLLGNMIEKVDVLFIGGAMANTFLSAEGYNLGKSLQENDMHATALDITKKAKAKGCSIVLPVDAVVAREFKENAETQTCPIDQIPADMMMLDVGPKTVALMTERLASLKTLVWNGPLGAFEITPFDRGTNEIAKAVGKLTEEGKLRSIAGGGDTVSALKHAGVMREMSYVSTAGGAFLEWLEGKLLPGIIVLSNVGQQLGLE